MTRRRLATDRQLRDAVAQGIAARDCRNAGTHPTDSGERATAILGGRPVLMARCAVCHILYPAPSEPDR